jgi:hypothetical protein
MNGWLQAHFGKTVQPVRVRKSAKALKSTQNQTKSEMLRNFSEEIEAKKEKEKNLPLQEKLRATSQLIDDIIEAERDVVVRRNLRDSLKVSTFYNEM